MTDLSDIKRAKKQYKDLEREKRSIESKINELNSTHVTFEAMEEINSLKDYLEEVRIKASCVRTNALNKLWDEA